MAFKRVELVEVSAWGKTVGAVARDLRSGYLAFEYDPTWVKRGIELSPLHLRNTRGFSAFRPIEIRNGRSGQTSLSSHGSVIPMCT